MKRKKRALSLLEVIIVIFLITLITGAIGYSMKGTLDKGRAFRTEQAIEQLHDLLLMCMAEGETSDEILRDPAAVIKKYGLAKNPSKITEDGWGEKLELAYSKNDFVITSKGLDRYRAAQKKGSSS